LPDSASGLSSSEALGEQLGHKQCVIAGAKPSILKIEELEDLITVEKAEQKRSSGVMHTQE